MRVRRGVGLQSGPSGGTFCRPRWHESSYRVNSTDRCLSVCKRFLMYIAFIQQRLRDLDTLPHGAYSQHHSEPRCRCVSARNARAMVTFDQMGDRSAYIMRLHS